MTKILLSIYSFFIFIPQIAMAESLLPLWEIKSQGSTDHCWAYASTHFLETRSLVRESNHISLHVEKDVKYWVDFERLMFIYQTKKDFYFGAMEGGWQIEFMETLVKHGKPITSNELVTPSITYVPFEGSPNMTEFKPEPRPDLDPELPTFPEVAEKMLTGFETELEARFYATNFLNRYYGKPTDVTNWEGQEVPVIESGKYISGSDFDPSEDAFILVKPAADWNLGWTRYLSDRYVGYRYDETKILDLIKLSLDRGWPVTFDNVFHAMTIVGYKFNEKENMDYFAVTDSMRGLIWYTADFLAFDINLITFAKPAIIDQLDPKRQADQSQSSTIRDRYDNVIFPPR